MTYITVTISALALALGAINFYWNFLRNKRKLIIARVVNTPRMDVMSFALINYSNRNIIISGIECKFGSLSHDGQSFTPAQKINIDESNSRLLTSGKGIICTVTFSEGFTNAFAISGKLKEQDHYLHTLYAQVCWIDFKGKVLNCEIPLYEIGLFTNGKIRTRRSLLESENLYKMKIKKGNAP